MGSSNDNYCEMIILKGDTEEHIRMYVNADDTRILDCISTCSHTLIVLSN